jgi:N-acetylglucosamine-6-phosphate deacetylase
MAGTESGELAIEGVDVGTGKRLRVALRGGTIVGVDEDPHWAPRAATAEGTWIGPGLIDLQINGYRGMDFNGPGVSAERVGAITRAVWEEGVTSYCPTVVTAADDAIAAALAAIAAACDADAEAAWSIAGIHLEGPFISPEDGPRGAHPRAFVKAPDWPLFERWQEAAEGRIRILTLAPEWPGAAGFIARCVEQGILVAIGHTAATPEQIREAVAAGARLSTHLGNGAHLTLPRHPHYIWEQLAQDDLWASAIADGFHLPAAVLKVIVRMKGPRALLVSDAVALSGLPAGTYDRNGGRRVVLTAEGKLHLADNPGILAGSAQMLPWGIAHLVRSGLCTLGEAWALASLHPAACLELPAREGIAAGAPADLVAFRWDGARLRIERTYKDGRLVYAAPR